MINLFLFVDLVFRRIFCSRQNIDSATRQSPDGQAASGARRRRSTDRCGWFQCCCGPAHRPAEQCPCWPGRRRWRTNAADCEERPYADLFRSAQMRRLWMVYGIRYKPAKQQAVQPLSLQPVRPDGENQMLGALHPV